MAKPRLFSKEIEPSCAYCRYGRPTADGQSVLCPRIGVCPPHHACKKFIYAPLKRIPKAPPALPVFDPSDFEL